MAAVSISTGASITGQVTHHTSLTTANPEHSSPSKTATEANDNQVRFGHRLKRAAFDIPARSRMNMEWAFNSLCAVIQVCKPARGHLSSSAAWYVRWLAEAKAFFGHGKDEILYCQYSANMHTVHTTIARLCAQTNRLMDLLRSLFPTLSPDARGFAAIPILSNIAELLQKLLTVPHQLCRFFLYIITLFETFDDGWVYTLAIVFIAIILFSAYQILNFMANQLFEKAPKPDNRIGAETEETISTAGKR